MKKLYITTLLAICTFMLFCSPLSAQKVPVKSRASSGAIRESRLGLTREAGWYGKYRPGVLKQIGISVGLSTLGIGIEGITPINDNLKLRAGLDYMPSIISVHQEIKVEDASLHYRVGGYYPNYSVDFKPSFFSGHVLINYFPIELKDFYITGGLYVGLNDVKAHGKLVNPQTGEDSKLVNAVDEGWPTLIVEGYRLNIDDGKLDATMRLGKIVKPYIGVGVGRAVPKYDMNLNCELGFIIQPGYTIRQYGKTTEQVDYESSAIDITKYTKWTNVYPKISFQVTFRAK
ncbi:MAG: hypothetical protein QM660_01470 [Dysgonomonas sp.]